MSKSPRNRPRPPTPGERPVAEPLRLGKYELVRPIGVGGMAAVYLVRRDLPGGGRKVSALKIPMRRRDQLAMDEVNREALLNEILLACQLSHSNIVQCLDAGIINGLLYMEVERIDGVDLGQMMNRMRNVGRPFSLPIAVYIVRQILEGLAHAHNFRREGRSASIIHRDINPQNVLVSSAGEVKIMDFGVGKHMADITEGLIRGKLKYMSPEQLQSIGTPKLDVFAVGAIFYELVTGFEFRARGTQAEMIGAALSQEPPAIDIPGFPPDLLEFYRCCVRRNHHERADVNEAISLLKRWRDVVGDAADLRVLYERQVDGGPHSGYTDVELEVPSSHMLELIEDIRAAAGAQTGEVEGVPADEPQNWPTGAAGVIEARPHAGSDPDAPAFMRRRGTPRRPPSGPTLELQGPPDMPSVQGPEPRRAEPRGTEHPPVSPIAGVAAPEGIATVSLTPGAASVDPLDRTAVIGADELERMRAPGPGSSRHELAPRPAPWGDEAKPETTGIVTAIGTAISWRWWASAGALVLLSAAVVFVWLARGPERRDPPVAAESRARATQSAEPEPGEAAIRAAAPDVLAGPVLLPVEAVTVNEPVRAEDTGPKAVPAQDLAPGAAADPQPAVSADAVPETAVPTASSPSATPVVASDPAPVAAKAKPKAASPKPKVEVRLAPFVKCEVLIGGKIRKIGSKSIDVQLPIGSQRAKWRPEGATIWYDVPVVRLEPGRRYMLTIYGPGNAKWSSSAVVQP